VVLELHTHDRMPSERLCAEWDQLVEEDPVGTLFQGPRYLRVWQSTLGEGVPVRVHTVHRDGRLVGVVPDANDLQGAPGGPEEIRRFQGGTEVTDYLGPVSRPEDRADVADAYLANLAADVDWDEFVAGGLARDGGWADALGRAAGNHGLTIFAEDVEDVCPRVTLRGSYDDYLADLPGKLRQELTRKTRKLARDAGGLELVQVPADEVVGQLDAFLDQAAESFPDKAGFFRREDMHAWFRALAQEFVGDDVFRLHHLQVGGLTAASTISLVQHGEWGLYNSSFDPTLGSLAPGMVIVPMLIEQAAGAGCRAFDLLRGGESYKYRFGAVDRPLDRLTIVKS
jgi:CelD/BcsL family acetyltransferase involved in cellulose biosynthesis